MGIGEQMSTTKQMGALGMQDDERGIQGNKKNANAQRYSVFGNCTPFGMARD